MKTTIYIVTRGKIEEGVNPSMTLDGLKEIEMLVPLVNKKYSEVICGKGKSHLKTAQALYLKPTRYTCLAGEPDGTVINISGMIPDVMFKILADGTGIDPTTDTSFEDKIPSLKKFIKGIPNNSIILGDISLMAMLGFDANQASIYKVICQKGKVEKIIKINT